MSAPTSSIGNIFADLGFSSEQAEELAVKAGLVGQIADILAARGLSQSEAASLIGTDQPTLSKVLRGRMASVTIDRLTSWLRRLGYDVTLTVQKASPLATTGGHLSVDLIGG